MHYPDIMATAERVQRPSAVTFAQEFRWLKLAFFKRSVIEVIAACAVVGLVWKLWF